MHSSFPLHLTLCIQIMLGIIKDWSNSTLTPFLCSNFCYGSSVIPLIYLNERKFVVLMLNCSFLLPTSFRIWQNFCEATISNIMPLIVNELNLAPIYYSWQRGTPWSMSTWLHIFVTIIVYSIPLTVKEFSPSTNWVMYQVTSEGSVTYLHILTYSDYFAYKDFLWWHMHHVQLCLTASSPVSS